MSICVSDMLVGMRVRFTFSGGVVREGVIVHNYGRGIVLRRDDGSMSEFDGGDAALVETLDQESASAWRQEISRSHAEFKQTLDRMKEAR